MVAPVATETCSEEEQLHIVVQAELVMTKDGTIKKRKLNVCIPDEAGPEHVWLLLRAVRDNLEQTCHLELFNRTNNG